MEGYHSLVFRNEIDTKTKREKNPQHTLVRDGWRGGHSSRLWLTCLVSRRELHLLVAVRGRTSLRLTSHFSPNFIKFSSQSPADICHDKRPRPLDRPQNGGSQPQDKWEDQKKGDGRFAWLYRISRLVFTDLFVGEFCQTTWESLRRQYLVDISCSDPA